MVRLSPHIPFRIILISSLDPKQVNSTLLDGNDLLLFKRTTWGSKIYFIVSHLWKGDNITDINRDPESHFHTY